MKTSVLKIVSLLLVMLMILSGCAPAVNGGDETTEATTEAVTEEIVTSAPTTNAVTTEEPTTEAPTTELPTTEEITTDALTTEELTTSEIPQQPKDLKILMIGNSFCYYFVEELYALGKADGYNLTVANLYKSGCSVYEHWQNGVTNKEKYYELYVTSGRGGRRAASYQATIDYALEYSDWDVISLQQHFYPDMAMNYTFAIGQTQDYAKNVYDYVKEKNPTADLYWHQTWAYQVGYAVASNHDTPIPDALTQKLTHENIKAASEVIAEDNGVKLIPAGDAWQIAREDSRIGDVLCARASVNNGLGDYYHDGDIGGGQYLNACVWYEVLTGKTCIGNTWRPNYELSEEKIVALQEAAHAAVAAVYGEDYVK